MRSRKRLVPGLLGLALAAPLGGAAFGQSYAPGRQAAPIAPEAAPKHEHKGLLGRRGCTECQRARAKARDGVDVPPPPSAMAAGAARHGHGHAAAAPAVAPGSTGCIECEQDAAAMGGTIVPGSIVVNDSRVAPPGRAVVGGGETLAAEFPAGRAVVGAEPAPIGAARASQGNFTPVAGAGAVAASAPRDASVMPSGLIPPQTAVGGDNETKRPKIITHLLDIPDLTRIGRVARENRERAQRENHASISYGEGNGPVTELPASMVFGKGR